MKGLKDGLLVGNRVTDICEVIGGCFYLLTAVMNRKGAIFQGFKFPFQLDSTVVFVVGEVRGEGGPEVMGRSHFGEDYAGEIIKNSTIDLELEEKIATAPVIGRDTRQTWPPVEKIFECKASDSDREEVAPPLDNYGF